MNCPAFHRAASFLLLCLLSPAALFPQSFETQVLNKGPLYGTASILQDYDHDGDLDAIVTRRSATRDPLPSSVELLKNDGAGNFTRQSLITEGLTLPADIDFDFMWGVVDDNAVDYVVCETNSPSGPGSLAVYWKEESGAYTKTVLKDSVGFDQAALAYFNNDAYPDIVAVGFGQPSVTVYLGRGLGAFDAVVVDDSVSQVTMVEADDIDGDGDTDIIIGGGVFRILYNDGSAGFDSTKSLVTYQNYNSSGGGIAIADLNNDSVKDILSFARVGFGGLYFLDGANAFEDSQIDIDGIDLGGDLVVFDIDGNGMLDIVRQNAPDSYIAVLYQVSAMKFRREIIERYWDNRGAGQMSVGDLDGDGDKDLFLAENGNIDGDVSWYENIAGKLYRHTLFGEIQSINAVKVADVDADGDLDIIVTAGSDLPGAGAQENEVLWYKNLGNGQMEEWLVDDNIKYPGNFDVWGLDTSRGMELVVAANGDSSLVYYQYQSPGWVKTIIDSDLSPPLAVAIYREVGRIDPYFYACEFGKGRVSVYEGFYGESWYRLPGWEIPAINPIGFDFARIDANDTPELIVVSGDTSKTVQLFEPTAAGLYQKLLASGQFGSDVELGDWNGDRLTDIIASFDRGQGVGQKRDVALFLNDGNGGYADIDLYHAYERTQAIKLVNIDNDNDLDLIIGGNSITVNDGFQLLLNEGDTTVSVVGLSKAAVDIRGIDAGDLDGDGLVEIVATDRESRSLLLLRGGVGTGLRSSEGEGIPATYALLQNYPNPFNPKTVVSSQLPVASDVKLVIYDLLGREVAVLVNERRAAGSYQDTFDGAGLASGVYYYRLTAGSFMQVNKMLLVK